MMFSAIFLCFCNAYSKETGYQKYLSSLLIKVFYERIISVLLGNQHLNQHKTQNQTFENLNLQKAYLFGTVIEIGVQDENDLFQIQFMHQWLFIFQSFKAM